MVKYQTYQGFRDSHDGRRNIGKFLNLQEDVYAAVYVGMIKIEYTEAVHWQIENPEAAQRDLEADPRQSDTDDSKDDSIESDQD